MEESAMDELYGDFGQKHTDSSLVHDEDSVDIYSGLDEYPKVDGGKGKDSTFLSPVRLKESMDLYEELITEEQEEKDATYSELKSKYDAAQNQVQELRAQLQLIQTKNSSLHRENTLLKKNICALIKTARMEIVRKDEEISKLSNRPVQSGLHQSRIERKQELCLKSQSNTDPSVKSHAVTVNESQNSKGSMRLPEVSEHKNGSRMASHPVHKVTVTDASQSPVSQRCIRNNLNIPKDCQGKVSDGAVQDCSRVQSDQTLDGKTREGATSEVEVRKSVCSETAGRQLESRGQDKERLAQQPNNQSVERNPREKDMMSKTLCDVNKSERSQKESVKVNSASKRSQCQAKEDSVLHRRSVRSKSPQHLSPSEFHSQTSKGPSSVMVDSQTQGRKQEFRQHGEDRHSRSGTHTRSEMHSSEKSGSSLDRKMEKRVSREHHRKEERRQEDAGSSERRHTRSDGCKDYEQKKARESEGRNREEGSGYSRGDRRSTRSEASKEYERRNSKESDRGLTRGASDKFDKRVKDRRDADQADVPKNRRDTSPLNHDCGRTRRKDHDKELNIRKNCSKTEEQVSRSKTSISCDNSREGKSPLFNVSQHNSDRPSLKEKDVDIGYAKLRGKADNEKLIGGLCEKSANGIPAADVTKSASFEISKNDENRHARETVQTECLASVSKQSPLKLTSSCDNSAMAEESSPKRKLSFMETLNLTLSPIKKQSQPSEAEKPIGQHPKEASSATIELGEEFCVIDEIENSQESVEAMDDDSALAADNAVHLHLSNSDAQPSQGQDKILGSKEPKTGLQEMEVEEKELELSKGFGEAVSLDVVTPFVKVCLNSEASVTKNDMSANSSASISKKCAHNSPCAVDKTKTAEVHLPSEESVSVNDVSGPSVVDVCKDQNPPAPEEDRKANSVKESQIDSEPTLPPPPPPVQIGTSHEEVSTTVKIHPVSDTCSNTDTSASLEIVSSTVSVDVNPQSEDGCAYTQTVSLDVEITKGLEKLHSCLKSSNGTQAETVKNSNLLKEMESLSEQASSSEPDSTENELPNSRLVGTVAVPQDEDSMMLTLRNIKVIPEAISPLTSPVRQIRNVQHDLGMEPHVKSLSKELSTAATVTDKDAIKTDMNKENKQPDLTFKPSVVKAQQEVLSATREELEEGEIDSSSDEESSLKLQSPPNEKTKPISKNQLSPRLPRLEKRAETLAITLKREQDRKLTAASKDSPTSNKRRFKTVTVPPKAKISTRAEFMNMLLFIRTELRRKYMKLHKTVTKSAFCCIVDMSQASFTEFVDGVNFQKFSCLGNEIKPRLNKIISSVMGKVSNNGIVNRIFEQRADDLKQKLWNFVDGQYDFLFKELKEALKSASAFSNNKSVDGKYSNSTVKDSLNVEFSKIQPKKPLSIAEPRPNTRDKAQDPESKPLHNMPCSIRGLGSRGKNINASMEEGAQSSVQPSAVFSSEKSIQENVFVPENKTPTYARHLSHSGSNQDRTDFDILTEQQTSSLTFNLVTDSQMGDIFRCLLQGSDLLEANVTAGDSQCWPLSTPRKECPGESLIGVVTPNKIITPSKLITTWTSISPYKLTSTNNKVQMPLNPALFDESCLLEVPSNANAAPGLTMSSQHSFSILAEDLAVSLTIPSPLKSEGHLSFLQPTNGQPLSAPSSVISAHFSEDALMDGEDATEQDIHLSLDTDNSSCGSSTGQVTWEEGKHKPVFHFKPDLPMQAEVMERSNDHFIVRIRHTSPSAHEETQKELKEARSDVEANTVCQRNRTSGSHTSLDSSSPLTAQPPLTSISSNSTEVQLPRNDSALEGGVGEHTSTSLPKITGNPPEQAADPPCESASSDTTAAFEKKEGASEANSTCERTSRKRRKHHSGPKAKCCRTEKHQDIHEKQRHKKRSRSCKEKGEKTPPKKGNGNLQESPNLSAKNVIRKKGEVVVTWTRDEDRDILVDLKMKGPSSKTFVALSTKLKKSPAQIEERFTQLMKLLKKKEKMEN